MVSHSLLEIKEVHNYTYLNNELDKLSNIWSSDCELLSAPRVELERRQCGNKG